MSGTETTGELPRVAVDIWSDVMCPWCAIGYTQFAKALKELEGEIDVEVRWMPFELNPDMPDEGRSLARLIAETYQRTPAELEDMRERLEEAGERAGFSMAYDGEGPAPEPMMWNTFEAHKLLRWALATQGMEAQTALKLALFRAHFQQRRRIGKRAVLLDIAENLGFDRQAANSALDDEALVMAVRIEEERARESDIEGVPAFVINARYLVPGAQDPEIYRETLRKVVELAREGEGEA